MSAMKSAIREQVDFWKGFGVPAEWFIKEDRTEAIAIGDGFMWSVMADGGTSEYVNGEWQTGIEI